MSKRLTATEHKRRGTYQPCRHAKPGQDAQPSTTAIQGRPKRPAYLSDEARKEWNRLTPLLQQRGSLTPADATALTLHCEVFARWLDCQRQLKKDGATITVTFFSKSGETMTAMKPHPALKIAQDCERSLRHSLDSFGLTPVARERVTPARQPEAEPSTGDGSFEDFMRARGKS
jgi:P27 family predicted phage terminase small subunit